MKRLIFALATIAMCAPARSEEFLLDINKLNYAASLLVFTDRTYEMETFRLLPGGCLKGPLVFFGKDHAEMFRLAPGADYPGGCSEGKGEHQ